MPIKLTVMIKNMKKINGHAGDSTVLINWDMKNISPNYQDQQ